MNDLHVFNIQHYCVHDGPGIRTTIFLKGCPLSCQWCCNPESQSITPQMRYSSIRCKRCLRCYSSCNRQAIHIENSAPIFDFSICNNCEEKSCIETCYHDALSVTGKAYTIDQLFNIIIKDKEFYDNSGGGVTFSGGEPLLQSEALLLLLQKCKDSGIHTAIETCGYIPNKTLLQIIPFIDLFLYDIKIIDSQKHQFYTSKDNKLIISNLRSVKNSGGKIIVRIPLIVGATDTNENVYQIIQLCQEIGLKEVQMGIYHTLGVQKYSDYGIEYKFDEQGIQRSNHYYECIRSQFLASGISCEIL